MIALNAFDLTLTLQGIAGIILSIGMAVDANVIIYARIRKKLLPERVSERHFRTDLKKHFLQFLTVTLQL